MEIKPINPQVIITCSPSVFQFQKWLASTSNGYLSQTSLLQLFNGHSFISNLNRQDLLTFSKLIVHQSVFCNISVGREFACVVLQLMKDHSITLMVPLWLHPYFNTVVVGLCCVNELFYYITSVSLTGVVREHLDPAAAFFPEATVCDDHIHSYLMDNSQQLKMCEEIDVNALGVVFLSLHKS